MVLGRRGESRSGDPAAISKTTLRRRSAPSPPTGRRTETVPLMAKRKRTSTHDWDRFDVGDQVKHPKFGAGTILFRSGEGEQAKAIVVFPEEGQKKLALRYAKLTKISASSARSASKAKADAAPKPTAPPAEADAPDNETAEVDLAAKGDDKKKKAPADKKKAADA